jgi:glycosyltransferase involved in cell wall biosynthesis
VKSRVRICVNSQTPFVKFKLRYQELIDKYGYLSLPIKLEDLDPTFDYDYTPGGVTSMIYPLLRRMLEMGLISDPIWISLGSGAPPEVLAETIQLHHIQLDPREIPRYANFKEGIWNEIHGHGKMHLLPEEYAAFTRYNWLTAEKMLQLLPETDLYFIHDFQQIQTGSLIGPSAPAILQWHIPFNLEHSTPLLKSFIMKNIEGFDSIIVSTRRDLEGLIRAGYRGRAYQIYPYIDPTKWMPPYSDRQNIERFSDQFRISENDFVVLVVARMDYIKSQDTAIKALSPLVRENPEMKLLLVGDGSFSGSSRGGLSHPKSKVWREELEKLVVSLRLEENICFTGYLPEEMVRAAYRRSDVVVNCSRSEGFGLTTLEGWMYMKPVVVSLGAGSSELVNEGVNGLTFEPRDHRMLAERIEYLLTHREECDRMGQSGFDTAKICYIDKSIHALERVFDETMDNYRRMENPPEQLAN